MLLERPRPRLRNDVGALAHTGGSEKGELVEKVSMASPIEKVVVINIAWLLHRACSFMQVSFLPNKVKIQVLTFSYPFKPLALSNLK